MSAASPARLSYDVSAADTTRREQPMNPGRRVLRRIGVAAAAVAAVVLLPVSTAFAQPSGGVVHAFFITADVGSGPGPILFHGAINAACTEILGNNVDHVVCPHGTFDVNHSANGGTPSFNLNPVTCVATIQIVGVPFFFQNGTSAYAGIGGNGLATIRVNQVLPRNSDGSCNTSETAQPVAGLEIITATANVSFAT
jgi:hypothetical protein